jgi:hypothetical protein
MAVSSIADKSFANINNTNNKMKDVPIKTTTYDYKNIIDKS